MGFEPMSPISQAKRLAGARTRPLCDPSILGSQIYKNHRRTARRRKSEERLRSADVLMDATVACVSREPARKPFRVNVHS